MKILLSMRDSFPPQRPDVKALFGTYLAGLGLRTDLISESTPGRPDQRGPGPHGDDAAGAAWPAGALHVRRVGRAGRLAGLIRTACFHCGALLRHSRDVDAIQVRDQVFIGFIGLMIARIRGIKFIYWMSFPFPEGHLEMARTRSLGFSPLRRLAGLARGKLGFFVLYRVVARHADHVFVQSQRMLEVIAERGVRRERMTAVPMGVDLAQVRAAAIEPASDHRLVNGRVLVYLGALDRVRRIDFLLHVLARVKADIPRVLLVLAGDASEPGDVQWLQREATRIGIHGSVIWLGWVPPEQAWRYVKAAEVGLSAIPPGPLYDVSSPTKALEYMALGIPVVATRIPDQEQVLAQSGAGVAVEYDLVAFADAIVDLLMEPGRARAMGARGPEYVARERDYPVLAARVAVVYRAVLAAAAPVSLGPR